MKYSKLALAIGVPVALIILGMMTLQTKASPSATFTVNSTVDAVDADPGDGVCETAVAGQCTLRAAVMEANAFPGSDTIQVAAGNYLLTILGENEDLSATGDLDITEELTITGAGQATTIVDGNQADRIFHILGAAVILSDMTITNGRVTNSSVYGGGGVLNDFDEDYHLGKLTLNMVTVSNNKTVDWAFNGGGILSIGGSLTVTNSLIQDNEANFASGGGISAGSIVVIENTTVSNNVAYNSGGGIAAGFVHISNSIVDNNSLRKDEFNSGGEGGGLYIAYPSTIENTIVSNNSLHDGQGGGLYVDLNASLLITNTKIVSNSVESEFSNSGTRGGGIYNQSNQLVTIVDSIIAGNYSGFDGGGIYHNLDAGQMTLNRVTVSQNLAEGNGAGIHNGGTLSIVNTTIAQNVTNAMVNGEGGGIYHKGISLTLTNNTVVQNEAMYGGGIFQSSGSIVLENTILADNIALSVVLPGQPNTDNCAGLVQSGGHNLEDGEYCNFSSTGDLSGLDALLFLSSTPSGAIIYLPMPTSPAIDTGSNASCPETDQRGISRPVDGNNDGSSICDIGAVEFEPGTSQLQYLFLPLLVKP